MESTRDRVAAILSKSPDQAARLILAGAPATIKPEDAAAVEQYLYNNAPPRASLAKLREGLCAMVGQVCPEAAKSLASKVAFSYPTPRNPFAHGVRRPDETYNDVAKWFAASLADWKERRIACSKAEEAAIGLKLFLVSAVLEFEILDIDYIPALVRSLQRSSKPELMRTFRLHRTLTAVPLALPSGSVEQAEERLFVAGDISNEMLQKLLRNPGCTNLLRTLAEVGRSGADEMLARLENQVEERFRFAAPITLPKLVRAARQVAVLRMPPAVAAHRGRDYVSHGLRVDVLKRLGDYNLAPMDHGPSGLRLPPDKEAEDPGALGAPLSWMVELRNALPKDKRPNKSALEKLAKGEDRIGRVMGNYALWLGARTKPKTIRRYALLIATRLMPRFDPSDPPQAGVAVSLAKIDKDKWLDQIDDDMWEEVIEQVLDEDEFFRRPDVADSDTRRRRGHSQALLSAMHSFIRYLGCGNKKFAKLHEKLPGTGPMRVDANLVTVDEYKAALGWLGSIVVYPDAEMIEASRVALILGYRLGLRRAESGFLRLGDFDDADHLHVRPSKMRKLKTSNARRDLPLRVLIPEDELRLVKRRIARIRGRAGAALKAQARSETTRDEANNQERTWRDALLFPSRKDPFRGGDFEAIVERVQKSVKAPKQDFPGDKDFHYHILRHAAANTLLLKLWPALHPVARRLLHRHPEMLKEIHGSEDFRHRLFGTDRLHGSDLQAIALLMGHGSSATTIEHYLHVMDWYRVGGEETVAGVGTRAKAAGEDEEEEEEAPA